MELKKAPQKNLERKRILFLQAGLLIALSAALLAFSWKSAYTSYEFDTPVVHEEEDWEIAPVSFRTLLKEKREKKEKKENKKKTDSKNPILSSIENTILMEGPDILGEDPGEETGEDIVDIKPDKEAGEAVPFVMLEKLPAFPGCEDLYKRDEQRLCFERHIIKHIQKNARLPRKAREFNERGKVHVYFVIDKEGKVTQLEVIRGEYDSLNEEALRVVELLPQLRPGIQQGKPVPVSYTVPINFQ